MAAKKKQTDAIEVRVLVDVDTSSGDRLHCNTIAMLPADEAEAMAASGQVDISPEAVEACKHEAE